MTQDQFRTTYRPNTGSNGRTNSAEVSPRSGRDSSSSGKKKKVVGGGGGGGKRAPSDWRVAGGPGRDHSVLIELELDKVDTP